MDIKDKLIKIRENKNYSKRTVSEMTGIPYTTYIKYESGERKDVSMQALCKLADFYGVTTDYLLGRPSAPAPMDPLKSLAEQKSMEELEEILLEKYLELSPKKREVVVQLLRNAVEEEKKRNEEKARQAEIPTVTQAKPDSLANEIADTIALGEKLAEQIRANSKLPK